jgi:hypothetical protein
MNPLSRPGQARGRGRGRVKGEVRCVERGERTEGVSGGARSCAVLALVLSPAVWSYVSPARLPASPPHPQAHPRALAETLTSKTSH